MKLTAPDLAYIMLAAGAGLGCQGLACGLTESPVMRQGIRILALVLVVSAILNRLHML